MTRENRAIDLQSPREIAALRDAGWLVAETVTLLSGAVRPGAVLRSGPIGVRVPQGLGRADVV